MRILATPNEVTAVGDAIVHYLDYVGQTPDITKEGKETVTLLARFQKRLAVEQQDDEVIAERSDQ